jgi:hypothetical protein
MIKINHRHFVQRLLVTAALPLGLMAAGAMPAFAAIVDVTGANGGYPGMPGGPGGAATADAGNLIRNSDPTNSATATGGAGGWGVSSPTGPGGAGGVGVRHIESEDFDFDRLRVSDGNSHRRPGRQRRQHRQGFYIARRGRRWGLGRIDSDGFDFDRLRVSDGNSHWRSRWLVWNHHSTFVWGGSWWLGRSSEFDGLCVERLRRGCRKCDLQRRQRRRRGQPGRRRQRICPRYR